MQHRRHEQLQPANLESPHLSPAQLKEAVRSHMNDTFSNWKAKPAKHNDHPTVKETGSLSPRPRQHTDIRGMTLKEYFRATPQHLETEPTVSMQKPLDDSGDELLNGELDNFQIDETEEDRYNDSRQSVAVDTPNFSSKVPPDFKDHRQIQQKIMQKYRKRHAKFKTEVEQPSKNNYEVQNSSRKKTTFPAIHNTQCRTLKLLENQTPDNRKKRMTSNPQHDKKGMRSTFTYFKDGKVTKLFDKQRPPHFAVLGQLCLVTRSRFYEDKLRCAVKL